MSDTASFETGGDRMAPAARAGCRSTAGARPDEGATDPESGVIRVVIEPMTEADTPQALALGRAAGLEEAETDTEGLLVRWGAYEGKRLIGTVALRYWGQMYVVGWMAVAADRRGLGVGRALLRTLEREAMARGADRVWAAARAPGFYYRAGFSPVSSGPERDALLGQCLECRQFGVSCRPVVTVKALDGQTALPEDEGRGSGRREPRGSSTPAQSNHKR